ncbi:flavin reductase family protein [Camelimonas abortus]|uniref:Flavin reductase family protein n=1 Tax=Camelimonas abortus TaxID=1017184 RepID=A0ABV7LHP3_9HYPH
MQARIPKPSASAGTDAAAGALRRAMRRVASSVAVVTTRRDGVDHGMTVTAHSSVSLDPPLVLVVINAGSSLHEPLLRGDGFCLNILDSSQQDVAEAFARPGAGASRFAVGRWRMPETPGAVALALEGAQAWTQCTVENVTRAGTHSIVTGRVLAAWAAPSGEPLIYLDGAFTRPR